MKRILYILLTMLSLQQMMHAAAGATTGSLGMTRQEPVCPSDLTGWTRVETYPTAQAAYEAVPKASEEELQGGSQAACGKEITKGKNKGRYEAYTKIYKSEEKATATSGQEQQVRPIIAGG